MSPAGAAASVGATIPARRDVPPARRPRTRLSKAVELFIAECRLTKAPLTIAGYESDCQRLVKLATYNSILSFTPELVRQYFLTASAQGNGMATLHRKRAALSEFGKWGLRQRYWDRNPVDELPRIPRPKHLPRPFTRAEVERLLALALPPHEALARALLFFTGLRVTPICSILIGNVSDEPPVIRVTVKGRRMQVVQLHPELRELLRNYILSYTDLQGQAYLLAQANGRPYSRRMVERLTHAWGEAAQVPACTPHRFRHTFATGLLQAGVDIRVIKEALGHQDIQSTMVYTQVTDAALEAAILKLPWGKRP